MKLTQLPRPVLACVLAIQNLYPQARPTPRLDGSVYLEIPHSAGGVTRAEIAPADLDANGERPVWLSMQGVPFGQIKLIGSQAVANRIKSVIEKSDEPTGGER